MMIINMISIANKLDFRFTKEHMYVYMVVIR